MSGRDCFRFKLKLIFHVTVYKVNEVDTGFV